jgi:hypothetical protein
MIKQCQIAPLNPTLVVGWVAPFNPTYCHMMCHWHASRQRTTPPLSSRAKRGCEASLEGTISLTIYKQYQIVPSNPTFVVGWVAPFNPTIYSRVSLACLSPTHHSLPCLRERSEAISLTIIKRSWIALFNPTFFSLEFIYTKIIIFGITFMNTSI